MNSYYVYILQCSYSSYYTGITNNIDERLKQHKFGFNRECYTYKRRPLHLKFHQEFNNVLQAIYFEKKIKGWTRAKKEALIDGKWDKFKFYQNVEMHHTININKHFDCAQCDIDRNINV